MCETQSIFHLILYFFQELKVGRLAPCRIDLIAVFFRGDLSSALWP